VLQVTIAPRQSSVGSRVRRLVPASIRRAAARFVGDRRAVEVDRQLAALARDPRPIVAGPWLGEVGFELLYWVPFVRWFTERYSIDPDRVIAVSRGGAAAWYSGFAAHSYDALASMAPDEFRARNDERNRRFGEQKQLAVAALDEDILEAVRREQGGAVAVLHPSLMYRLFAPFWWGHRSLEWVRRRASYRLLEAPSAAIDLPADYIAVKFYFNDCFRSTPENRAFVDRTVRELEREGPVISLSTGVSIDDHAPCDTDAAAATRSIRHLLVPQTNLLVQSAVVAGARRFVGTYGGFAYLAPFYGVPADSYYTEPGGFSMRHLDLARDVLARTPGAGRLDVTAASAAVRSAALKEVVGASGDLHA
jgi:hypothetical protein